ncbi:MAG TPA: hypothetical protein PKV16_06550 [Caldisericia bacterium]|nr:hypothetical protein [Caldisericia bacterium]HPF48827.1 hypothetical protein [Caldisericia bacterium]HPI84249.1 hypothetical protein [Caldisericia bacterium]HPQ93427.1 hypothetical protein [Caldisericia bacterium]HRV74885.1 hypothetical protein [Caldisericia bacterium]
MRKLITVSLLAAFFMMACSGGADDSKMVEYTFPSSSKLIGVSVSESKTELVVEKGDSQYTIALNGDAEVIFDQKVLTTKSLQTGQTLYIEGEYKDGKNFASIVVISEWPGMAKSTDVEKPLIKTDIADVPKQISKYLSEIHHEMGIEADAKWEVQKPIEAAPGRNAKLYRHKNYLMQVTWYEEDFPRYNVVITAGLVQQAQWSGKLMETGEVQEIRYAK